MYIIFFTFGISKLMYENIFDGNMINGFKCLLPGAFSSSKRTICDFGSIIIITQNLDTRTTNEMR